MLLTTHHLQNKISQNSLWIFVIFQWIRLFIFPHRSHKFKTTISIDGILNKNRVRHVESGPAKAQFIQSHSDRKKSLCHFKHYRAITCETKCLGQQLQAIRNNKNAERSPCSPGQVSNFRIQPKEWKWDFWVTEDRMALANRRQGTHVSKEV